MRGDVVLILYMLVLCPISASSSEPPVSGAGSMPCSEAIKEKDNVIFRILLGQWAWGYLSGLNFGEIESGSYKNLGHLHSEEQVSNAILIICQGNQNIPVAVAVNYYFLSLENVYVK